MKRLRLVLLATGILASVQTSLAAVEDFTVALDAAQAGGAGRQGTGSGTLTFDSSVNQLTFNNIVWSGLSGNSTDAHIHGPAAPGTGAGVIYPLASAGFTTGVPGATAGTISGTLQLVDGTAGMPLGQQVSDLEGGQWYINIHSSTFGGGEIRGQILPVPEPSTLLLLGVGTLGLLGRRRGIG